MNIVLEERHIEETPASFQLLVQLHPSLIEPINGDPDCTNANALFELLNRIMFRFGYDTTFSPVDALPITDDFNYEDWEVSCDTQATHLIISNYAYGKKKDFKNTVYKLLEELFNKDGTAKISIDEGILTEEHFAAAPKM